MLPNIRKMCKDMSPLYFGTGASSSKDYNSLYMLLECCIQNGIHHFDTAPSYKTEQILGKGLKELAVKYNLNRKDYFVQTKIDPWQMQNGKIERFISKAIEKMDVTYLDSLLIHWPVPEYLDSTWAALENAYRNGEIKRIGICNVRSRHLKELLKRGIRPHIVQIERNPLRVCEEEIKICRENGIEIQAYSPLCKMDDRIKDSALLERLAEKYKKNIGQIVMRWHLDSDVTPVFTTKKESRIKEYADIFGFSLQPKDVEAINAMNENYKMYLESCICPGF